MAYPRVKWAVPSFLTPLGVSALILVSLVSCLTTPEPPSPYAPVYITDRGKYSLLPPAELEYPMDMPQQISGRFGTRELVMNAWIQADHTQITMVLFNSFGTGMGEVFFREGSVSLSSPLFPPSLKPEYIIADFQFCFYRAGALSRALEDCGLALSVEQDGYREIRTITERKKPVIKIEKTKTVLRYTNYLRDYSYTLEGDF